MVCAGEASKPIVGSLRSGVSFPGLGLECLLGRLGKVSPGRIKDNTHALVTSLPLPACTSLLSTSLTGVQDIVYCRQVSRLCSAATTGKLHAMYGMMHARQNRPARRWISSFTRETQRNTVHSMTQYAGAKRKMYMDRAVLATTCATCASYLHHAA